MLQIYAKEGSTSIELTYRAVDSASSSGVCSNANGGGGDESCEDLDPVDYCEYWANNGDCTGDKTYMDEHCANTCNVCGDTDY